MLGRPATEEAYQLLHDGSLALSAVEEVGFCVDVDYVNRTIDDVSDKIKDLEDDIRSDPLYRKWRRRFGEKTKLGARDQLAHLLFNELGYECKEWTDGRVDPKTGQRVRRPKADEQHIRDLDNPFANKCLERDKYVKARNTFLIGIRNETCEGRLHAFFNLAGGTSSDDKGDPRTYRSSSDSPNMHNFPTRDDDLAKLVRQSFIPSCEDNVLIEADFKGVEVSIAYCYHRDRNMRKYLLDKSTDMHRDMAIQCYKLEKINISPGWWKQKGPGGGHNPRYVAKNKYVFPQFYGDYYINCAKNMWDDIRRFDLALPDGTKMKDHLKRNGIKRLGNLDPRQEPLQDSFERHMKDVERHFWNVRFKEYGKWKQDWYQQFVTRGWFQMKTGFVCSGMHNRKQVINYPVQGAAFHCLLWSLIRLEKWLRKNKMKTRIVSQIHDSMILDAPRREVKVVVAKLRELLTQELRAAWEWIVIPLEVDIEIAEKNWYKKVSYEEWSAAA